MGNTTRQGMKFGLILLLLLAGVVLGIRMLLSREGGRPRYTDMPQLLALCDSKNAPAVKEALLHSDEGALRNEETTLLHVLLERDADPAVLREALSRFKMTGMIVSRTKKGMILGEPSLLGGMKRCINPLLMNESTLRDILEFRIALEIGISNNIFCNLTPQDIEELEQIVEMSQVIGNNKYAPISEHRFHTKLYEITGNRIISEFQDIIYPVLDFVKEKYRDFFEPIEQELIQNSELVTHRHLLEYIKRGDLEGYKHAIVEHFKLYTIYLERHKR